MTTMIETPVSKRKAKKKGAKPAKPINNSPAKNSGNKQTKLIMLGTGNAMVTRCYNTCFILRGPNESLLVDAGGGNGIMTQLAKAGVDIIGIRNMFVTHAHTDHLLGVIWVMRMVASAMEKGRYNGRFRIFCHDGVAELLTYMGRRLLAKNQRRHIGERLLIVPVSDNAQIYAADFNLTFFDIHSTKARQFGFRAELPDGKILACLGDEPFYEGNRHLVSGADWLLSEAFCLYADREIYHPYDISHSTAKDAGEVAADLGVSALLLYHTVDDDLAHRREDYTAEAAAAFSGRIEVPDDLDVITL